MRFRLATLIWLVFSGLAAAQVEKAQLEAFNKQRIRTSRVGMTVLGGWAVANLLVSGLLIRRPARSTKESQQLHVGWNLINAGLAGFGLHSALTADPATLDLYETLKAQYSLEKTFLFNAGLDVGYVLGGLYLTERAKTAARNPERLRGFGQSVMLQGGFLFAFALVMFFIVTHHGHLLKPLLQNVTFTGSLQGVGIGLKF